MKNKSGLREALEVILDAVDYKEGNCLPTQMVGGVLPSQLIDNARKTLAEEKAELSLAELADKKGFTAIDIIIRNKDTNYSIYFYKLNKNNPIQGFDGRTYAEAEQKAKLYLEGLK